MGDAEHVASGYRRFAAREARRSALYAEWAAGVAGDPDIVAWLSGLPQGKRQPNLLFAAVRLLAGTPPGFAEFRDVLAARRAEVEAVVLARRTQTNEPARCALLLPALAALPQPLALLEVGASAGLCLLPDRYAYDYAGHRVGDAAGRCCAAGPRARSRCRTRCPKSCGARGSTSRRSTCATPTPPAGSSCSCGRARSTGWTTCAARSRWPGRPAADRARRPGVRPPRAGRRGAARRHPGHLPHGGAGLRAGGGPRGVRVDRARARRRLAGQESPRILGLAGDGPALASGPPPEDPFDMALARDGEVIAWTDGHGVGMRWL